MRTFLTILFVIICVALTAVVLMQEGKDAGLGSIGGISDSYWNRNKSRSMEGNLVRITRALAIAYIVVAIVLNIKRF